ncbi:hypothetical protein MSAN_00855700 [Mycena sanguinolenta]|uniref:Golgi apparatus membrane protein TVP38 n=1 Tax=Mycena sanguinolenta TaxID=230812 RepID=A0A8H6Z033_9AGAR|nr:hypothetical protein MSAN_00855700 [Mycena sanguinolenta]
MSAIFQPRPVYTKIHDEYPPERSATAFDASSMLTGAEPGNHDRNITRTPSPTPEEYNLLHDIKPERTTRQKIITYAVVGVLLAITIVLSVETKNIVHALQPATNWLNSHPLAPLIPISILIVISFPPLFGQELVATFVGATWNLPAACAIVAAGTLIGEIANFFVFKYACSARGAKLEEKNLGFGLLAYVVRTGSFRVILIIRYSAIPPHYSTSAFATVGISFWIFLGAAILSLPKGLVAVFVGYVMQPAVEDNGTVKIVENVVLVLGIVVTIVAYRWIQKRMKDETPAFVHARRKARQSGVGSSHYIDLSQAAGDTGK